MTRHTPATRHALALLSAAGLMLATHLFAAGTNDLPYLEPFESYAVGQNMLSVQGWEGDARFGGARISNDAGDLARLAAYTNAGGSLPLTGPHDQLLTVPVEVRNRLEGPQGSVVLTDVLVQPEFRAVPPPEPDPTKQLGVYVNSNGLLYVYHQNLTTGTNEWDELSGGPVIASNTWIRLRVTKDYANHSFQLRINEAPPVSDPAGWTLPAGGTQPGNWFRMVQTNGALQRVVIRGAGNTVIDDLVVTSGEAVIETLAPANIGVGQADLRGFLSHAGLSATAVEVYYGTSNGGTNPAAWGDTNTWAAPQPQGLHVFSATGLAELPHHYRFAALNGSGRIWAEDTQSFSPYGITISAPDNEANEEGLETGTIRVSRPAAVTNGAQTVNLDIGGTADNGADYVTIGNTIEIADGASDADITITPLPDPVEGSNETVVISIAPGDYGIGSPSNATVTIVDRPASDLTWDNGSGDGNWNTSSLNWIGGVDTFGDWDRVNFLGSAPGQVYIGDGVSSNAVDVYTERVVVQTAAYTFVGGKVLSGEVQVKSGGTLTHAALAQNSFGSLIRLQGGALWRTPDPDDASGSQSFVTPIVVEAESVLNGRQGYNTWGGTVELRDRLNLGRVAALSLNHAYTFTNTITINQDTNNVNDRVIYQRGENQAATFSGAIVDDTNATHTGTFPLHIGTRSGSGNITFTGANTYSHGTTVMYEGNNGDGLVVNAGSSLGTGPVTVEGIAGQGGALLTLDTANAVQGPLTLEPQARVVVNAADAVSESVGTITVHDGATLELNTGIGIHDLVTLSLMAVGRVDVTSSNINETVYALIIDGVNQPLGVYRAADHPGYILGTGSIKVDPRLDAMLLIVR